MGSVQSRSVEIQISNNTQNITLRNPRTYFGMGYCFKPPLPELSPGSSDTCSFWGDPVLWGLVGTRSVSGILVYEAESFTLAIYFYNPIECNFSLKLGLELSPGKAHLDNLGAIHNRMAGGIYSSSDQDIEFACVIAGKSLEIAHVSHGPIKVMATVSSDASSRIKVVLEQGKRSKAGERNPF